MENDNCKSLWDFTIQSDHAVQPRRPDILVINKRGKTYQLINVAYPADRTVDIKEEKEIDKYQDLAGENRKLWNVKVREIPVVNLALGTVPKELNDRMKQMEYQLK